jgi:hypothetical protein
MSKQTINIGASPNDGTGTPLRTSFDYTNQNFTELYTALGGGVGLPGATTQVIFNDGGTNLAGDAGLVYNKTTDALTVAGLVTAGSATITGAATVGTTLGVTGATNLSGALTVSTGANATPLTLTCSNAAGTTFNVANTGGAGTHYFGGYNALVGGGNATDLLINSAGQTIIRTGSTNVATFTTAGNVSIANGNLVMSTSGKGIDFSAVTGGTGTATGNVLNDYEEGTFTATLKGGTTDPTIAVTTTGKYTKIGNQVFVRIMFGNVSTVGASGTISITGLPFTSATTPEQIGYLMVENMATFTNSSLSSYLPASSTTLSLYTSTSNSVITAITHYAGVARYLWTAITYTAA